MMRKNEPILTSHVAIFMTVFSEIMMITYTERNKSWTSSPTIIQTLTIHESMLMNKFGRTMKVTSASAISDAVYIKRFTERIAVVWEIGISSLTI